MPLVLGSNQTKYPKYVLNVQVLELFWKIYLEEMYVNTKSTT